jgi:hypothetical protein
MYACPCVVSIIYAYTSMYTFVETSFILSIPEILNEEQLTWLEEDWTDALKYPKSL